MDQIMFENQTAFGEVDAWASGRPVVLGAGPAGRAVAAALVRRGARPLVVTRSGASVNGADARAVDLSVDAAAVFDGAGVVFQCAQPPYHRWPEEFPALQRTVVDACERAGAALVALENVYAYGPVDGPMTEVTPMRPTTRKGRVRAEMWAELERAHTDGRVRAAAVRAADFYGPGVLASMYGERFFPRLVAGGRADVMGDPEALHSITYIPDLGEAMVLVAGRADAFGRAWHAPTAPAVTQRRLVELAAEAAGGRPSFRAVGPRMLRFAGLFDRGARETVEMMYEFDRDFVVDSSAFEHEFGVSPTPLETGIAATVHAFARTP